MGPCLEKLKVNPRGVDGGSGERGKEGPGAGFQGHVSILIYNIMYFPKES